MRIVLGVIFLGLIFQSCGEREVDEVQETPVAEEVVVEEGTEVSALEKKVTYINESAPLVVSNSLVFSEEIVNQVSVEIWSSKEGKVSKLTEMYQNGEIGDRGVKMFYFDDNGSVFCVQERFEDMLEDSSLVFVEHITYLNNGEVLSSKKRVADYEDYIDEANFVKAEPTTSTPERAFAVVNQTGDYATHFRNFLENGSELFLIIGSQDPKGYNTAVRIDGSDEFVMDLYENQEKYKGKKLQVDFEIIEDQNQFQFQVYTGGRWIE